MVLAWPLHILKPNINAVCDFILQQFVILNNTKGLRKCGSVCCSVCELWVILHATVCTYITELTHYVFHVGDTMLPNISWHLCM